MLNSQRLPGPKSAGTTSVSPAPFAYTSQFGTDRLVQAVPFQCSAAAGESWISQASLAELAATRPGDSPRNALAATCVQPWPFQCRTTVTGVPEHGHVHCCQIDHALPAPGTASALAADGDAS